MEPECECGHVLDEHDEHGHCTVEEFDDGVWWPCFCESPDTVEQS